MLVDAQVLGQLVDAGGQDGNLNLGGAGVALVSSVLQDVLGLLFLQNHDVIHLSKYYPSSQVGAGRMPLGFGRQLSKGHSHCVWQRPAL